MTWRRGKKLGGEFVIEDILGAGGMGKVYRVRRLADQQIFALKTLHESFLDNAVYRNDFFRELRFWIDLPEHPHIVTCCFFRTIENRAGIFSEYVDGGSLHEWIQRGRIDSIDKMLDIAIQIAWGLQSAHQNNIVHQDIKPANVMMTQEGIAKLTDFGLANAVYHRDRIQTGKGGGDLVTAQGLTMAYCSPEQAIGGQIGFKTDIWSFAVSLLEMCIGNGRWKYGFEVDTFLRKLNSSQITGFRIAIPDVLLEIFMDCLIKDLEKRVDSIQTVATRLIDAWRTLTGIPYFREAPSQEKRDSSFRSPIRKTLNGEVWDDPIKWKIRARKAAGVFDESPCKFPPSMSRESCLLWDLQMYDDVADTLSSLIQKGDDALRHDLAILFLDKSLIHRSLGDLSGAESACHHGIEILENLNYRNESLPAIIRLARGYNSLSMTLSQARNLSEALASGQEAIALLDPQLDLIHDETLRVQLARCYVNQSTLMGEMKRFDECEELLDRAILLFRGIVRENRSPEILNYLAAAFMNKGSSKWNHGKNREALELIRKSLRIRIRLHRECPEFDVEKDLIASYTRLCIVLLTTKREAEAIEIHDKLIRILTRRIEKEGLSDDRGELARIFMNQSFAYSMRKIFPKAIEFLQRAINLYETMILREGRTDTYQELARAYTNLGVIFNDLKDFIQAYHLFEKAEAVFSRLVYGDGKTQCRVHLAYQLSRKAWALEKTGNTALAIRTYRDAESLYEVLSRETGSDFRAADVLLMRGSVLSVQLRAGDVSTAEELRETISALREMESQFDRPEIAEECQRFEKDLLHGRS